MKLLQAGGSRFLIFSQVLGIGGGWGICQAMRSIRKELTKAGLTPRRKWGQHFLVDRTIVEKVIQTAQVREKDVVLEVGPGLGEMTLALAQKARKVIAVEIDPKLVEILADKISTHPNVRVIKRDILKLDFNELWSQEGSSMKVVANLPYQISSPLLFRFMESKEAFSSFTLMLQREVAERLVALPGKKEYGPLTVFVQAVADVTLHFLVKPSSFFPAPKVESAVIQMTWKERPVVGPKDEAWFKRVVKGCLGYRRKTLANALKHSDLPLPNEIGMRMERIGIDPRRRSDTLTIHELANLASALRQ